MEQSCRAFLMYEPEPKEYNRSVKDILILNRNIEYQKPLIKQQYSKRWFWYIDTIKLTGYKIGVE